MKFDARDGSSARTLAVTAAGWYRGSAGVGAGGDRARIAATARAVHIGGGALSIPANGTGNRSRPQRTTTVSFVKGQEVFGPGRGAGLIYIVRTGCVRLYKTLPDGRSINLGLLGPNTVFAQEDPYEGLSTGASAEALVDSTVSIVEAEDLATVITETPELASSMVQGMTRRMTELQTLAEHLLVRDTSVRLATTLMTLARGFGRPTADGLTAITLPLTHQSLANMIGSNRVTVTRKLIELQEKGLVKSLGRNAIAVDPDALLAHAQAAADAKDDL